MCTFISACHPRGHTERYGHCVSFNHAFKANGIKEDWSVDRYEVLLEIGCGKVLMIAYWNEVGWPAEIPGESFGDSAYC